MAPSPQAYSFGRWMWECRSVLAVATTMVREEGWRVALKGIGAAGVRAFVVNSVIFSVRFGLPCCLLCLTMQSYGGDQNDEKHTQRLVGPHAGIRVLRGGAVTC